MTRILTIALLASWLIAGLIIARQNTRLANLREIVSAMPIDRREAQ